MGTDIPLALVETRVGNTWQASIDRLWPHPDNGKMEIYPVFERHYELFSVLADVRNRTGRGTKTLQPLPPEVGGGTWMYDTDDGGHDPLVPISNPKGMPSDASTIWSLGTVLFGMRMNLHDLTYLTLEELTTTLWDQQIYRDAYLTEEEYLDLRDMNIQPKMLARSSRAECIVNEVEYAAGKRGEGSTVVFARWRAEGLRESAPWFFDYLETMQKIAPDGDPKRVRLLIAFDS